MPTIEQLNRMQARELAHPEMRRQDDPMYKKPVLPRDDAAVTQIPAYLFIGIDTGVNTGLAIWDKRNKKLLRVSCVKIHDAMEVVRDFKSTARIRVEDARLRKWLPKDKGRDQLQGAGSIKRDASIWEDFLRSLGADFEMVAPKNNKTKLDARQFQMITGWHEKTNEHARDAAMLVYGL